MMSQRTTKEELINNLSLAGLMRIILWRAGIIFTAEREDSVIDSVKKNRTTTSTI